MSRHLPISNAMPFNLNLESLFQKWFLETIISRLSIAHMAQEALQHVKKGELVDGDGSAVKVGCADKWLDSEPGRTFPLCPNPTRWLTCRTRHRSLQCPRPFSPNPTIGHIPQPIWVISIQILPLVVCRILRGTCRSRQSVKCNYLGRTLPSRSNLVLWIAW